MVSSHGEREPEFARPAWSGSPGRVVSQAHSRATEHHGFETELVLPWPSGRSRQLTDLWRKALNLPANTQGVVVSDIDPDTPAAQAGLVKGDVIEEANRNKLNALGEVPTLADSAQGNALLLVSRQGKEISVVLSANP